MEDHIPPITIHILRICNTKINKCKTHFLLIFHLFQKSMEMLLGLIWLTMLEFLAWDQHHNLMVDSVKFRLIIKPRFRNKMKFQIHQRKWSKMKLLRIKSNNFNYSLSKTSNRQLLVNNQIPQFWPEISCRKMD